MASKNSKLNNFIIAFIIVGLVLEVIIMAARWLEKDIKDEQLLEPKTYEQQYVPHTTNGIVLTRYE